ncbi:MAG: glycosyltransferase [Halanaerobiales bacterium]|nr:glycosyltransferase [Halanaerobiales bacterium]
MIDNDVIVSVVMVTYNHESYIRQSIESVLKQKTDFKYEILIGEDSSTDKTRKILEEFDKKYPKKFNVFYREKNIGPTKNIYDILKRAKGKYIALLEGDDYWKSQYKLQTQIEILEKNKEFIGSVHSCDVIPRDNPDSIEKKKRYKCIDNSIFTFDDFKINRVPGHFCTMVFRNIFKSPKYNYDIIINADDLTSDRTINMLLLAQGDFHCIDKELSTYRLVKKKGESNINSIYMNKNMLYYNWQFERKLNKYCKKTFNKKFLTKDFQAKLWLGSLIRRFKNNTKDNIRTHRKLSLILFLNPTIIFFILIILFKKTINKGN